MWAEAKTGDYDTVTMFVQLILTIGKAKTFDKTLPPEFLGAFDFHKISFVPYISIEDIFHLNDFNWNVTPSNHETKEFQIIKERIESILTKNTYTFNYIKDKKELEKFIKTNIALSKQSNKIKINKNNFIPIYLRWLEVVKPIIAVDWEELKKSNILDSDFYLADLFVDDKNTQDTSDDVSIKENLFVIYQNEGYKISKENLKQMFDATININNNDIYQSFWKSYKRPPQKKFQEYIIQRRDLIVPQDIRERKGAFFTPRQWVELSQKYIADVFGEDWQDEYYVWDCAAGTGNLLAGLTNKYNIYASTLDQVDVNVMHENIKAGKQNLLEKQVFQFDFLNDSFDKLPQSLQDIINDKEKRKKLILYINPPYAEAGNKTKISGKGEHKAGTTTENLIYKKYESELSKARNELFAQFLIRIYKEIPKSKIANFSKLKNLQGSNFKIFRQNFRPKLEKLFLTPADTFDNVKGKFPIGFFIWNGEKIDDFDEIKADIYNKNCDFLGFKNISSNKNNKFISQWIPTFSEKEPENFIGILNTTGSDFQQRSLVFIASKLNEKNHNTRIKITIKNLIQSCIFFTVRLCIKATWLNDRDQFLYPKDGWQNDFEFQLDCLTFTLFHTQNRISSKEGENFWVPFSEQEVDAKERFSNHFMIDFISDFKSGKIVIEKEKNIQKELSENTTIEVDKKFFEKYQNHFKENQELEFSKEAKDVFEAGKELWKYYHKQYGANVNASYYDIREYFQGRSKAGRMNSRSDDETYTKLNLNLKEKMKILAQKIKPKVYEYEFLK